MSDENQNKVAPVNTVSATPSVPTEKPENSDDTRTPTMNVETKPAVTVPVSDKKEVPVLGMKLNTAGLIRAEDLLGCSLQDAKESMTLGNMVKIASALSQKTVDEVCVYIDTYGLDEFRSQFEKAFEEFNEKKV